MIYRVRVDPCIVGEVAARSKTHRHEVAVLARARLIEAELISRGIGTTAEKEMTLRPAGKRLDCQRP